MSLTVRGLPLLVALVGLLVYLLATKAEAKEIGRLMFACGLLVALFGLAPYGVAVLGK